jgi:hypothetical protein
MFTRGVRLGAARRLAVAAAVLALVPVAALRADAAVDRTPPRITGAVVAAGRGSATVTWRTNEVADGQVEFGLTRSYGTATTLDRRRTLDHARTLRGLLPDRTYHYRIWTRNARGLLTRSADHTFRTRRSGPVPLVIDTDLFSNADDVGALATAFALQQRGEARVLAIGLSTRTSLPSVARSSWRCVAAIAQFYGAGSVPIGSHQPHDGNQVNTDEFAGPCGQLADPATPPPGSAVRVYRRALAGGPDGRVTMVGVGYSQNLAALLDSPADDISPLTGRQLITRKVQELVLMAGGYPHRAGENNLQGDVRSAQRLADAWPTPVIWSGYEVGDAVHTGSTISTTHPTDSPVRVAYEAFVGPRKWIFSYDLTAVYHAVRAADPLLVEVGPGSNVVDRHGGNRFTLGAGNDRHLRLPNAAALDRAIDDLLQVVPRG